MLPALYGPKGWNTGKARAFTRKTDITQQTVGGYGVQGGGGLAL